MDQSIKRLDAELPELAGDRDGASWRSTALDAEIDDALPDMMPIGSDFTGDWQPIAFPGDFGPIAAGGSTSAWQDDAPNEPRDQSSVPMIPHVGGAHAPPVAASSPGGSASASLQAERVRYSTHAWICRQGEEDAAVEASVLNLSQHGLACRSEVALRAGERAWIEFRLNLGEDPLCLLCDVVWSRSLASPGAEDPQQKRNALGLRFIELTSEEASRIDAVVRERVAGRAGDWPLPIVPQGPETTAVEAAPPVSRGGFAGSWVSAAAGLAAGIGLALLLAALAPSPAAHSSSEAVEAQLPPVGAPPVVSVSAADDAAADAAIAEPTRSALSRHAEAAPLEYGYAGPPALDAVSSVAAAAAVAAAADLSAAPAARVSAKAGVRAPATKSAPAAAPAAVVHAPPKAEAVPEPPSIGLAGDDNTARLTLVADGPVEGYSAFWLVDPVRLVVDIPQRHSGVARKAYEFSHRFVKRVRIGEHPFKVRFVIETTGEVTRRIQAEKDGQLVRIVLTRG